MDNLNIIKSCECVRCQIDSLFFSFKYRNQNYTRGGIYRHPNGCLAHFINDLEITTHKIDRKTTSIITGDINIDII